MATALSQLNDPNNCEYFITLDSDDGTASSTVKGNNIHPAAERRDEQGATEAQVASQGSIQPHLGGLAILAQSSDLCFDSNCTRREVELGRQSSESIVDGLLFDIYDRWHYRPHESLDSDTFTECSSTSDAPFHSRCDALQLGDPQKHAAHRLNKPFLERKDGAELHRMRSDLEHHITQMSWRLVRQLKRRERRLSKLQKSSDVITAVLQASSLKRRIDSKIRFSIEPLPGDDAFHQWTDAMRAVTRLPLGIPPEFRKKVWLALADNHISCLKLDWEKTKRFAFNERSNPDDNKLGMQIVKDLHRTGCSGFSGQDNDEDRAVLKRVLLAYARWNKSVGYCQGFNVLAALILDVTNRREDDALKVQVLMVQNGNVNVDLRPLCQQVLLVNDRSSETCFFILTVNEVMIFLVDHVLPDSYFANNLRALSVDMAVFRDLLKLQLPQLSKHLDYLQYAARDQTSGASYEPPLTNVFTMQWFLTLFATCLPKATALRVWDSVLLEGSEILLRTALAIWAKLQDRILNVQTADEFYTMMGVLTQEMLDNNIIEADALIKTVYSMGSFPLAQLLELREKYTYNITPFTAAMSTGRKPSKAAMTIFSEDEELDEEDMMDNIGCFTGMLAPQLSPSRTHALGESDRSQSASSFDISKVSPGAYAAQPQDLALGSGACSERMTLDMDLLQKQYGKLRERQNQAHIILANATARHHANTKAKATAIAPIESPVAVNHLFIGRNQSGLGRKNRTVTEAPHIAPLYPMSGGFLSAQTRVQKSRSGSRRNSVAKDKQGKRSISCETDSNASEKTARVEAVQRESKSSTPGSGSDVTETNEMTSSTTTLKDMDRAESSSDVSTIGAEDCSIPESSPKDDCSNSTADDGERTLTIYDDKTGLNKNKINKSELESESSGEDSENSFQTREKDFLNDNGQVARPNHACQDETLRDTSVAGSSSSHGNKCSKQVDTPLSQNRKPFDVDPTGIKSLSEFGHQSSEAKTSLNLKVKSVTQGVNVGGAEPKRDSPGEVNNGKKLTLLQLAQGVESQDDEGHTTVTSKRSSRQDHLSQMGADYIATMTYNSSKMSQSLDSLSSSTDSDSAISPKTQRFFNPFPSQHINQRRAQNGIRLGLYSADNVPKLETGLLFGANPKSIGRSQINACLHRQYMAEIKQSRTGKR